MKTSPRVCALGGSWKDWSVRRAKHLKNRCGTSTCSGFGEVRNGAASAARKADVVAVSASRQREFPGAVRAWLDMWLWLLEDENPALLALFDSSDSPNVASICAYLGRIAQRAEIGFFSAHRQLSLFPVVRPKEEAIWPEPVGRALLSWLKLADE